MSENDSKRGIDLAIEFVYHCADEWHKGRDMVWIDRGLAEWIDTQVEAGTYKDRTHAVEEMIKEARIHHWL